MPKVLIYDVFLETFYEKSERNIYEILMSMRYKNREKNAPKKNNHTKQYSRDSAIYYRLWSCNDFTIHSKNCKRWQIVFSFKTTTKPWSEKHNISLLH